MKKAKKLLSIILSVITLLSTIPVTVNAAEVTGTCGENVTWVYDESISTLTISGEGAMNDYSTGSKPWEKHKTNIKKVVIENGVTTIGGCAFYNYDSLSEVVIPESVDSIRGRVFRRCDSLTRLTIPTSVKNFGFEFSNESLILDYCGTVDEWETIIYNNRENNSTLHRYIVNCRDGKAYPSGSCGENLTWVIDDSKTLTISGTGDMYGYYYWEDYFYVEDDRPWGYYSKLSIENVIIKEGVTSIGDSAFAGCYKLTNVIIPDSVTSIGDQAFSYCDNLTSITIPDSVDVINRSVFSHCSNLTDIVIPNSVTSIGDYAFNNCDSLTSITIPDSVTTIGNRAFYDCDALKTVTIGDGTNSIGEYAFYECDALETVTIGDGTKSIGEYAFYDCGNLTTVTIGDSTEIIGDYAFNECDKLSTLYLRDNVRSSISYSFSISKRLRIYYSGTEEQWKDIYTKPAFVSSPEVYCNYHIHKPDCEVVEPTCTTHGYEKQFCRYHTDSTCDYIATTTYTANPTGHTLNEDGVCEICGEKETTTNHVNTQMLTIGSVLAMVMNLLAKIFGVFSVA
ncbi:MAG: leucine-rich repeat protein [Clostridia bacterium]|nr:leucine-rich repeat protein [Clostridia bacterium]